MGLFNSIKQAFYNRKFLKAKANIDAGNVERAFKILKEIEKNHPEALTELTRIEYNAALLFDDINKFKKVIGNRIRLSKSISNYNSFQSLLSEIEKEIIRRISNHSKNKNYLKACEYSGLLVDIDNGPINRNIFGETKIAYFVSLTKKKDNYKAKQIIIELFNEKANYNRTLNQIIENHIYDLSRKFKEISAPYNHCNELCKLIFDTDTRALKLYMENCTDNIRQLEMTPQELSLFYKNLHQHTDIDEMIGYYKKIIDKINSAKPEFIKKMLELSDNNNLEESIRLLDKSISLLPDKSFFEKKIHIIKRFPNHKFDEKIRLLVPLIGQHEEVEPTLAQTYIEQSKKEKVLDKKRVWLEKAYSFKERKSKVFNANSYETIFNSVLSELHSLALEYSNLGYYNDSYEILLMLYKYDSSQESMHSFYKIKIIESRMLGSYDDKFLLLKNAVEFIETQVKTGIYITNNILFEILDITEKYVRKLTNDNAKIQILTRSYSFIAKYDNRDSHNIQKRLKDIQRNIITILFNQGKEQERKGEITNALSIYDSITSKYGEDANVETRKFISLFKMGSPISKSDESNIQKLLDANRNHETQDLAYRYALYLLNSGNRYDEASDIIQKHLPHIEKHLPIRQFCKNESVKASLSKLNGFNQDLMQINSNDLSVSKARLLLDSLDDLEKTLASELPDLKGEFLRQKEIIQDYILKKIFEKADYLSALDILLNMDNSSRNLHNAAIAALGAAKMGKLNLNNYKKIISIWITAVFQDYLFIESLSYTSWDNQFSFTLFDSLGEIDDGVDLPENVNYDDPIFGSVSIGMTQKKLLDEFQNVMIDVSLYTDSHISKFEKFYAEEMDAIIALFSLALDKECFHATPYYAGANQSVLSKIKDSLENEFTYSEGVDYEKVLEVGVLFGMTAKKYEDYKLAKTSVDDFISIVETLNQRNISQKLASPNLSLAMQFPKLYSKLELELQSILRRQIDNNVDFKTLSIVYLPICEHIKSDNLNFIFSTYLNRYIISQLNDENSNYRKSQALDLLLPLYSFYKGNLQMNSNIQLIINASVIDIVTGKDPKLLSTILESQCFIEFEDGMISEIGNNLQITMMIGDRITIRYFVDQLRLKVSPNKRREIDQIKQKIEDFSVNMEVSQIIDEVNNNTCTNIEALNKMYDIYREHPTHQRLCENMIILCDILINEEIISNGKNVPAVRRVLNMLINNKSSSFKLAANKLAMKYRDILRQLDYHTRTLLTGNSDVGLNDKGIALKEGLNYYKNLSQ
ncbi:hypothetical protein LJC68_07435 [Bacteroidales bacterium OttesenSCG-928-B11]|nr:hypothetical protein [Bacteroidales bacterium OttesenSCG-928-B11]